MPKGNSKRPDREGHQRQAFEKQRKKILLAESICALCGQPVDKSLKYPDPWSPVIDHIVPVSKGGHPSDPSNLQLAHAYCNRLKGSKTMKEEFVAKFGMKEAEVISCDDLPLHFDFTKY